MGRGATATIERLAASLGGLDEAAPRFDPALDVSKGGVLLTLPALLACGLLRHAGKYWPFHGVPSFAKSGWRRPQKRQLFFILGLRGIVWVRSGAEHHKKLCMA